MVIVSYSVSCSISLFCNSIYLVLFFLLLFYVFVIYFFFFFVFFFFFSSRRRHTRSYGDWSSDVCSSDLMHAAALDLGRYLLSTFVRGRHWLLRHVPSKDNAPNREPRRASSTFRGKRAGRSEERRVGKEWRWGRGQRGENEEQWGDVNGSV